MERMERETKSRKERHREMKKEGEMCLFVDFVKLHSIGSNTHPNTSITQHSPPSPTQMDPFYTQG